MEDTKLLSTKNNELKVLLLDKQANEKTGDSIAFAQILSLIAGGADPNIENEYSLNIAHFAAYHNRMDVLEALKARGQCNFNCQASDGRTPLHFAAEKGYEGVVRYLLEDCQADPNIRDEDGLSAAHFAAYHNRVGVLAVLKARGQYNFNCQTHNGRTPLHFAGKKGHKDVVAYLVENCQADPNIQDANAKTAIEKAMIACKLDVINYYLENLQLATKQWGNNVEILALAAEQFSNPDYPGYYRVQVRIIINKLVQGGISPNVCSDKRKKFPVEWAVFYRHLEGVKFWIKLGANPNNVNGRNQTALDYHVWEVERRRCPEILIENDENKQPELEIKEFLLNASGGRLHTDLLKWLYVAIEAEKVDLVEKLLNLHVDPNNVNSKEQSVLDYCLGIINQKGESDSLVAIKALLEKKGGQTYIRLVEILNSAVKKQNEQAEQNEKYVDTIERLRTLGVCPPARECFLEGGLLLKRELEDNNEGNNLEAERPRMGS